MKLINMGRGNGKTTMLIHTAYVTGMPIVVATLASKEYLLKMAHDLKCTVEVFTVEEFRGRRIGSIYKQCLVDNVDLIMDRILNQYLDTTIVAGTMCVPMDNEPEFK